MTVCEVRKAAAVTGHQQMSGERSEPLPADRPSRRSDQKRIGLCDEMKASRRCRGAKSDLLVSWDSGKRVTNKSKGKCATNRVEAKSECVRGCATRRAKQGRSTGRSEI